MKRTLCMLLLLCLMPLSFSTGGEGIFYEAEDYICGLWAASDGVYALDGQRVVRLTVAGGEVQCTLQTQYAAGAYDGEALWCARFEETDEGEALRLERMDASGSPAETLSFDAEEIQGRDVRAMVAMEQGFCLLTEEDEAVLCLRGEAEATLVDTDQEGYDLRPRSAAVWTEDCALLAGEDGGEVRFYLLDMNAGEAQRGPALSCMDPQSFGCLAVAGERLGFVLDEQWWEMDGLDGEPQALARTGLQPYLGSWGLLTEEGALLADPMEVAALQPGAATENALTVQTNGRDWVGSVARRLGQEQGIEVEVSSRYLSYGELSQAMLTGSDEFDVYVTSLNWPDYDALYDKGYLVPLEDEELKAWAARVYPSMAEAFTQNGVPVAIPVAIDVTSMAYNPRVTQALGITELPATWRDFFCLLAQLSYSDLGDYFVFNPWDTDLKQTMLYTCFLESALLASQQMEDTRGFFNSPEMRATLEAFEQINFDAFPQGWEDGDDCTRDVLFFYGKELNCYNYGWDRGMYPGDMPTFAAMPLSFRSGEPGFLEGSMDVAIINPHTRHPQAARLLLKALWADLPETMQANLLADWDTPLWAEALEEGKPPEYLVSPEDLAVYQSYAPLVRIDHDDGLGFDGEHLLVDLVTRYLAGNLTAGEFLDTLDQRWSMMLLEKQ